MKVVFATDDKETISRMTGRAKWFAFYNIENGEVKEFRVNVKITFGIYK